MKLVPYMSIPSVSVRQQNVRPSASTEEEHAVTFASRTYRKRNSDEFLEVTSRGPKGRFPQAQPCKAGQAPSTTRRRRSIIETLTYGCKMMPIQTKVGGPNKYNVLKSYGRCSIPNSI